MLESQHFQTITTQLVGHESEMSSATLAFAVIAARMAATDAGVTAYVREAGLLGQDSATAIDVCRPMTGAGAIQQLRSMPPFLRTFLFELASVTWHAPANRGRAAGMLDYRPNTEANLGTRALSLLPILGLHFGTHSYSNLAKLSTWQRRMAVVLLIDKSGMSEKLFGQLKDEGVKLGTPRLATTFEPRVCPSSAARC